MNSERSESQRNDRTPTMDFFFIPLSFRIIHITLIILVPLHLEGVFGVDVKSVMEGDSVTLYTDLTEIQKAELILWTFGSGNTRIVQINRMSHKISIYDDVLDGRFRDRLKLDKQTGSLTITNTTTQHTGLYGFLQIIGGKQATHKKFNVIVSAHLPVPVISGNSSQCSSSSSSSSSSSYCSLLCSVVNVGHVTLSWYKGNSLLSSISVSDLSISLSLPLEVEYQEKNSYSCVINNPIRNQTTHLDISKLCHTCSASDSSTHYIVLGCFIALAVVAVFCGYYYHQRTSKQAVNQGQPDGEEHIGLTNGVVNGNTGDTVRPNIDAETPDPDKHSQNSDFIVKDEIKLMKTMSGKSVTLHSDLTEIQDDELIWWKFADSSGNKEAVFTVIAKWDKTNNEENLCNEERFRDRLHLDHNTGSLTITNITNELCGHYKLHITSDRLKNSTTFSVAFYDQKKRPEIQRIGLDSRRVNSF
ncbi:uncharacterized protein LOC127988148 isoform X2 [Carassius gibelio]|uniref:uncharacterized protein LOC127988148 isoform X2 n=1 Tax=Carassius gibelio TaxID=101364 RepID=UPI002279E5AC|nr:uncharacterized protein LOC127988148 isoform X2 [Carassius gibelio]